MFLRERMGVSSKTFENQILLCSDRDYGLHQDFQKIKSIYEIFNNLSKEYKTRCSIRNGMDDVPIPFLYWRVPISDFTPIYSIKVNEALSEEFLEEINTLIVLNE